MAQRQGQRRNRDQGQNGARNGQSSANTATNGRVRPNGANGANRGAAASTFTAETTREERARATGRRARQRIAQEQAAKRRRLGIILGAATAVIIVAVVIAAFALNSGNKAAALNDGSKLNPGKLLAVGTKAPDFDLATVDGKHYKLSSLHGRPVLLEFFAVWCPHCQAEAPRLNQLDKSYAGKGLQTLSILSDPLDRTHEATGSSIPVTKDDITWFQNTYNVAHPMLIDPDFSTVNRYGVNGYPTIYIVDKNGVIRYSNNGLGDVPYQTLAHGVDEALRGVSVKTAGPTGQKSSR